MSYPTIIQGGMGVAVSNWRLARAVALRGGLGVISGTLLAVVLARRLADGDEDMRRALNAFPFPAASERILQSYFRSGGKGPDAPYPGVSMPTLQPNAALTELTVAACFAEVYLAKEGHSGVVGINLLEKIQLPTLPSLYGAMLAGVDYVLMGAGIPRAIPQVLDRFAAGEAAELKIDCVGADETTDTVLRFDPRQIAGETAPLLRRPTFLAVVSSAAIATTLAKKSSGKIDGFVIEGDTAGGHNAPPRGAMQLNERGEPIYGPRDVPDLQKFRELGLPFWLAGSQAEQGRLDAALAAGAAGIQVGTTFAFSDESGFDPQLKAQVIAASRAGSVDVLTDPAASPTGFPFKVAHIPGTLSDKALYEQRERVCDLGYLRQPYRKQDGSIGYRCSAEPVEDYVRKGGDAADCVGRKCLCNALAAAVGLPQIRKGVRELPLVTAGAGLNRIPEFTGSERDGYSANTVMDRLQGKT